MISKKELLTQIDLEVNDLLDHHSDISRHECFRDSYESNRNFTIEQIKIMKRVKELELIRKEVESEQ